MKLIVTQEWGPYKKGDQITDTATINAVLASYGVTNVVAIEGSAPPTPIAPLPKALYWDPATNTIIDPAGAAAVMGAVGVPADISFRQAGGKVVALYYGEWRTDASANSWNRYPWSWLQKYPDRIPLAAIETSIPRSYDFTGSKLHGWVPGNNTAMASGATGAVITSTSTDPTIFSPSNLNIRGATVRSIYASIKRTAGAGWDGYMYFITTDDPTWDTNKRIAVAAPTWDGSFKEIEFDAYAVRKYWHNSTVKQVRFDFGNTATDAFELASVSFHCGKDQTRELALPAEQQWAMDWECKEAKRLGVDVFAVNHYWSSTGANWAGYSLDLMESSTVEKPLHCISWANHDNSVTTQANLDAMLTSWNARFASSNYWRINGKPVVYVFDFGEFGQAGMAIFGSASEGSGLAAMINYMQTKIAALPGSNATTGMHIVPCGRVENPYWTGRHDDWVGKLEEGGASAVSGYSYTETYAAVTFGNAAAFGGTATGTFPAGGARSYADLVDAGVRRNAYLAASGSGIPHWPCVMSGRDSRPWQLYNAPARSDTWNTLPDPNEYRRALLDAATAAVASHKACLPAKRLLPVITIYAWNELAEGGFIVPTIGRGYSIASVLPSSIK